MKKSLFRPGYKYFHLNLDFQIHPIFKELDWIFVQNKITEASLVHNIELQALVMMDTHFHLLVQSNDYKENYFSKLLSELITGSTDPQECHCEPLLSYPQYVAAYKYIYRNPIEAGLADTVESYPYSTLPILLGKNASHCRVVDRLGLIQNPLHLLNWLNNKYEYRFSILNQFDKMVPALTRSPG